VSAGPADRAAPAVAATGATPEAAPAQPAPPPPVAGAARAPAWPMWALGLVILVDEVDKNIVRGLITPLKAEFGVGDAAIGVLLSAFIVVNGLVTVPAGYLADRWHRTRTIGATVVGWSVLSAAGGLAPTFPALVALRSALGFGQAVTEPSAASLIGDWYPVAQRGRAFAIQQVMMIAGVGVGVGLGGVLGEAIGWRWAMAVVAVPGLVIAALVLRLREPRRGAADRLSVGGTADDDGDGDDEERPPLFDGGVRRFLADMVDGLRADLRTIVGIRTMRYALVGVAALLFTITAVAAWLPQFYIRHLGVPEGDGETWFTVLALLGGVPGVLVGGRVADRWADRVRGARLALPALFLFSGNLLFTVSYCLRSFPPAFALELVGPVRRDDGRARPAGRPDRRRPRPPPGRRLRGLQPRRRRLRRRRRAHGRRRPVVRLRREPPDGLPPRQPVRLPRRRRPLAGQPLPRRRHAEDLPGRPDGDAGGPAAPGRRDDLSGQPSGRKVWRTGP
jgi:hypothetical protein